MNTEASVPIALVAVFALSLSLSLSPLPLSVLSLTRLQASMANASCPAAHHRRGLAAAASATSGGDAVKKQYAEAAQSCVAKQIGAKCSGKRDFSGTALTQVGAGRRSLRSLWRSKTPKLQSRPVASLQPPRVVVSTLQSLSTAKLLLRSIGSRDCRCNTATAPMRLLLRANDRVSR